MIIACSVVLGIETFYTLNNLPFIFAVIDSFFTIFFIAEILLRVLAEPNPLHFFKLLRFYREEMPDGKMQWRFAVEEAGFWNWFDTIIVVFSASSIFYHIFEHPEFLVVSRLFRVLRIMRLLEVSKELKAVEKKIISIIPTVFSFALLLGVLLYIYSIIGIYLFSHKQYAHADFSNLGNAFLTLFQLMTLDGWSDLMYSVSEHFEESWFIRGYFISFVLLTAIVSFNVFVAVLTSQVQDKLAEEKMTLMNRIDEEVADTEQEMQEGFKELMKEIKALRAEIAELKQKGSPPEKN
jgi:voltage-gated sodium channel